jgi:hypothetical protein
MLVRAGNISAATRLLPSPFLAEAALMLLQIGM